MWTGRKNQYSFIDLTEVERILNEDLEKLSQWANTWLTSFNPLKPEVLIISKYF